MSQTLTTANDLLCDAVLVFLAIFWLLPAFHLRIVYGFYSAPRAIYIVCL